MKLIEQKMYESWQRDLEYLVRHHRLENRWKGLRSYYYDDFACHVDVMIAKRVSV